MSKIKLTGSNSGYVEISSAADAGNLTLNLPTSGTALLSNGDNVYTGITTFSNDLKLEGGSYDVLWDSSDNQLEFGVNAKLSFGASSDLQLYHNGSNSMIEDHGTGNLEIRTVNGTKVTLQGGGNPMVNALKDAQVELYFNNSKKIETTNTGAVVTGICTATSFAPTAVTAQLSHRNILHNGEYQINQKGLLPKDMNSHTDNDVILDRWYFGQHSNLGDYRISLETDAPAGFKKSIKIQCTSTDTSSSGSEQSFMQQIVEAQNISHVFNGSNSQPMTLSFYYKSNATTIRQLWFYTPDTTRMYSAIFAPSATNTWEKFTIPIPADTSNTINDDNGAGLYVRFMIASGTVYKSGRPTSWQNLSNNRYSGVTNLTTSTANNFYVTGVQLEMGSVATPFEHRSFGEELSRCERYFQCMKGPSSVEGGTSERCYGVAHTYSTSRALWSFQFKTEMRSSPTVSINSVTNIQVLSASAWNTCSAFVSTNNFHKFGGRVDLNFTGTPFTANGAGEVRILNDGVLGFDAEL